MPTVSRKIRISIQVIRFIFIILIGITAVMSISSFKKGNAQSKYEDFQQDMKNSYDAIIVQEGHEWILPVTTPLISMSDTNTPLLIVTSDSSQEEAIKLLKLLKPRRCIEFSALPEGVLKTLKEEELKKTVIEAFKIEPNPMKTGIFVATRFWNKTDKLVIGAIDDQAAMLQGSNLALHMRVPFIPVIHALDKLLPSDQKEIMKMFEDMLKDLEVSRIIIAVHQSSKIPGWVQSLNKDTKILMQKDIQSLLFREVGNIKNIIVTRNPSTIKPSELHNPPSLWMAPYLSFIRKAPIILSDSSKAGEVEKNVNDFINTQGVKPRSITILADYELIGVHNIRINKHKGSVEPCATPPRGHVSSIEVGRIPCTKLKDTSILISRMVARTRIFGNNETRVTMVANSKTDLKPLPLAETNARATCAEIKNVGVPVDEFYEKTSDDPSILKAIKNAGLIIYQGHVEDQELFYVPKTNADLSEEEEINAAYGHNIKELDGLPFVVLQCCRSLKEPVGDLIFKSGGVSLIGTTTPLHSASGSAFVKVLCDGLLYHNYTVGEALMYARNYFYCLAKLKKKRDHKETEKVKRVALTFRLWGDPELKVFNDSLKAPKLPPVSAEFISQGMIKILMPKHRLPKTKTDDYSIRIFPGTKLAGIVKSLKSKNYRRLMRFYFFRFPVAADFNAGKYKKISVSDNRDCRAVFMYDAYQECIYVLYYPDSGMAKRGVNIFLKFSK